MMNVRFLSGFRREAQFPAEEWTRAREALTEPVSFNDAVARVAPAVGGARRGRAVVLHLLWRQSLTMDMSRPLQGDSVVVPA